MALNDIQTRLAKLMFLEGYPELAVDGTIELYTPLIEKIQAHFGHSIPVGLQFREFFHGSMICSENVPDSFKMVYADSIYTSVDLPGTNEGANVFLGSHPDFGKIALFTIEDSGVSGIDGGLVLCESQHQMALSDLFPSGVLVNQEYVQR